MKYKTLSAGCLISHEQIPRLNCASADWIFCFACCATQVFKLWQASVGWLLLNCSRDCFHKLSVVLLLNSFRGRQIRHTYTEAAKLLAESNFEICTISNGLRISLLALEPTDAVPANALRGLWFFAQEA